MPLSEEHVEELRAAKRRLEVVPFHIQASNIIGKPVEVVYEGLPGLLMNGIGSMVNAATNFAFSWAATGVSKEPKRARTRLHKFLTTAGGAVGGVFGLPGVMVEMPITTTVMLRSIAEIARENGFDVTQHHTRLQCLQVFAMGGRSEADDAAESAYFAMRAAHAQVINQATAYFTEVAAGKKIEKDAIPALIKIIEAIAKRFGKTITTATMGKVVPVIGGAGGATMNLLFTDYCQAAARGHFTVLRLERLYGAEEVKALYEQLEN